MLFRKHRTPRATRATLCLLLLAVAFTGACASKTKGQQQVQGFTKTRDLLAGAQGQVDATLGALNGLLRTPMEHLDEAFAMYKKEVGRLEKEGEDAKWRAQTMKEQSDLQISTWQKEMESISDPDIKASLKSRQDAVRANYALIRMYADDARKAYDPFLKGNQQMVKGLSIDLSPAALNSLGPAIARVTADGVTLKQKLSAMQHAMDNTAGGLSPIGM
jgi:hypothetical protein